MPRKSNCSGTTKGQVALKLWNKIKDEKHIGGVVKKRSIQYKIIKREFSKRK